MKKASKKKASPKKGARKKTVAGSETRVIEGEPVNEMRRGELFSVTQQEQLLQVLQHGASPSMACQQLGLSVASFFKTFSEDDHFRDQYYAVLTLLSQNILMAMYRQAMEGNTSAQSLWLKSCPPPGWTTETRQTENHSFLLDETINELTDDEFLDLARAMELNVPTSVEAKISSEASRKIA